MNVTEYNVEGRIINAQLDHSDIPGPYHEYTKETLEAFLNQFDTVVKPSIQLWPSLHDLVCTADQIEMVRQSNLQSLATKLQRIKPKTCRSAS